MITGFGNNIVSALAADITASQTTIQVMPGTGELFASILTYDYINASNELKVYAKITLTDSGETSFEVCHLLSVSGDSLTVIRGQEGTTSKGWSLNDVIANFATRGSENQFVQLEQLQSGHYTAGVAGGTANALTLALPASFFLNGSNDWQLRTPLVVYPGANNTGSATLQLTMGGKILGTFKLYKGNKTELIANDILKDVALICILDKSKTFFSVANPGAIYAGLGTAAFKDIVTSMDDITTGRIPVVGWMGLGGIRSAVIADENFASFWRDTSIVKSGITMPYDGSPTVSYLAVDGANQHAYIGRKPPGGTISWVRIYSEFNKPSTKDIWGMTESIPAAADLNSYSTPGLYYQGANNNAASGSNYPEAGMSGSLEVYKNAGGVTQVYRIYSTSRCWSRSLYNGTWSAWARVFDTVNKPTAADVGALPLAGGRLTGTIEIYNAAPIIQLSESDTGKKYFIVADGSGFRINEDSTGGNAVLSYAGASKQLKTVGQFNPGDWANFDARYQAKGSYAAPNTASKAANGWWQDASTGMIYQWVQGAATTGSTNITVAFPKAFPNACFFVSVSTFNVNNNDDAEQSFELVSKTNSNCVVKPNLSYGSKGNVAALVWAVGY